MINDFELYLDYLENEIYFCNVAIKNIDKISTNEPIEPKMLFYHANNLFNSIANISKITNSNTNKFSINRAKDIKNLLHLKNKKIDIINNRQYRNSNEHYDERIDELLQNQIDCSHIDFSVFNFINTHSFNNFGRLYITSERTFYFTNSNISTEKICLNDIEKAMNYIQEQINQYHKNLKG